MASIPSSSSCLPSPSKLTPHESLVKFGEDQTKKATRIPISTDKAEALEESNAVLESLQKSQIELNEKNTIEIYKTSASKQRFSVRVLRDSGLILKVNEKSKETFKEVLHFDPKSFPKDESDLDEIAYEDVAFINTYKQYITPKSESEKTNTIEIFKILESKERYSIIVDRDSGFMVEGSEDFQYILKFDSTTFPPQEAVEVNSVGYWNKYNQYIGPKN